MIKSGSFPISVAGSPPESLPHLPQTVPSQTPPTYAETAPVPTQLSYPAIPQPRHQGLQTGSVIPEGLALLLVAFVCPSLGIARKDRIRH